MMLFWVKKLEIYILIMRIINNLKINKADIIASTIILTSLLLLPYYKIFWLIYAIGCFIYIFISYKQKLYGAMIMNMFAITISIINYLKH